MLTFTWTDYINFAGIAGPPNYPNNPLVWRLFWYADNQTNSDFSMLISLTRTNIVSI
jgi:hypothetical protein